MPSAPSPPAPATSVSGAAALWLLGLALLVTAVPVGVALVLPPADGHRGVPARVEPAAYPVGEDLVEERAEVSALAVLRAWDRRRAAAWAAGDLRRLRSLYLPASRAGAHDLAMLRAWRARGAVVEGLRPQVLAAELLVDRPARLTLRVTERLVGARARIGRDVAVRLPASAPLRRVVELRRVSGRWRVAAVRSGQPG